MVQDRPDRKQKYNSFQTCYSLIVKAKSCFLLTIVVPSFYKSCIFGLNIIQLKWMAFLCNFPKLFWVSSVILEKLLINSTRQYSRPRSWVLPLPRIPAVVSGPLGWNWAGEVVWLIFVSFRRWEVLDVHKRCSFRAPRMSQQGHQIEGHFSKLFVQRGIYLHQGYWFH